MNEKVIENDKEVTTWVENIDDLGDEISKKETPDLGAQLIASGHIQITLDELLLMESRLPDMPVDKAKSIIEELYPIHIHDPRYDPHTLSRMKMFIEDSAIMENPDLYEPLIYEMRIFSLLATTSSAYPEVRAVSKDTDDPSIPSLTIRVFVIGTTLSAIGCVINAVFGLRFPGVGISAGMVQLVSYPLGVGWAKVMPKWNIFGVSLNPGPFSKKEHLLVYCMAVLGVTYPPTQHLIFVQAMPQYFNMAYARQAGYQFLGALGTNLIGFGFAGLTRRFLVYPSYCVWPASLGTIAINNALHEKSGETTPVRGPFRSVWRASMYKCFWIVFAGMFFYYFFPSYMFPNLTIFDWMAWIKPTNGKLVAVVSANWAVGFGFNPLSTFDYAYLTNPGGYYPQFIHYNYLIGITAGMLVSLAVWFRNAWSTGYIPVNATTSYDNKGWTYSVTNIVDSHGVLVEEKYQQYSAPYLSAASVISTMGTFMFTTSTLVHTLLYNFREIKLGFRSFYLDFKNWFQRIRGKAVAEVDPVESKFADVHSRLMQAYPEVPEWWFLCILAFAALCSFICLGVYTPVSPAVVLAAPILTLIFIVPIGIVSAISGMQPSLNTISEMIGGLIAGGDTMTVQYFRMFGSEPVYHALIYANDLKLGHYMHIAPRHMFIVQIWGALVGTILTVGQWNWLMDLPGICTPDAPFRLICPAAQYNYTAFIFWGTIGAKRLFGPNGRYRLLLIGFPLGVLVPVVFFLLKKKFPRSKLLQSTHPLLLTLAFGYFIGGHWGSYFPGVVINWFSWNFLKVHYLEFWSRYNYVTLGAISSAMPINAVLTFFALTFPGVKFPAWWGNTGGTPGCIGNWTNADCAPFKIDPAVGYFGPPPGQIPN